MRLLSIEHHERRLIHERRLNDWLNIKDPSLQKGAREYQIF